MRQKTSEPEVTVNWDIIQAVQNSYVKKKEKLG